MDSNFNEARQSKRYDIFEGNSRYGAWNLLDLKINYLSTEQYKPGRFFCWLQRLFGHVEDKFPELVFLDGRAESKSFLFNKEMREKMQSSYNTLPIIPGYLKEVVERDKKSFDLLLSRVRNSKPKVEDEEDFINIM